jgi:nicotinate-nucleotide adenylyltransferase
MATPTTPRIALFGTSADPPTRGHQRILTWLADHYDTVAVWASDNPFKQHHSSLDHRMGMLGAIVAAIAPPRENLLLCPDLSSPRTIETLGRARDRWPDATFTVVIGSDLVTQLPTWYRAADILQRADLLAIPRPGYPLGDRAIAAIEALGGHVEIANFMGLTVSSTAYREARDRASVPPVVEAYIRREKLYLWQDAG